MTKPRLNPDVLLSPAENGYLAYDAARDHLYELNPVAALITELCDGARSVAEITALAAPFLPEGQDAEAGRWIEEALRAGLLVQDGQRGQGAIMDAPALGRLAAQLRDNGKVQAAYLCQKRVTELSPDDADAWCALGEIAHIVGARDSARLAYERYSAAHPEDAEVAHILTALRDQAPPARVPDACILQLYKTFSSFYESSMVETLGYQAPEHFRDMLATILKERDGLSVLDLGCGTGLAGVHLRPRAARLVGVDLSPEMAEKARARGIYDCIDVAEITNWLGQGGESFDLIAVCDTLIYFGDLFPVVAAAAGRLKPGGFLVFSVERGGKAPFHLTDSGRYAHSTAHIEDVARQAGLSLLLLEERFLRMEYGNEVTGLIAALARQDA